ncbi:MAG: hypothetical protein ABIO76_03185 [Ginsengibacter sp.]
MVDGTQGVCGILGMTPYPTFMVNSTYYNKRTGKRYGYDLSALSFTHTL